MHKKAGLFKTLNYGITSIVAAVYIASLIRVLFENGFLSFAKFILVPLVGVIICSILRNLINAKRPYEIEDFDNYLGKKTVGKSFPSRHVFSVFIIAVCVFKFFPVPGAVLFLVGIFLCYLRVAARVHFVKDVCAGAVLGILLGLPIYLI